MTSVAAFVAARAYAGVGLFWISYWKIGLAFANLSASGALPGADAIGGARFFFERIAGLLIDYEWQSIPPTLKNGLRFVVWQNPSRRFRSRRSQRTRSRRIAVMRASCSPASC